MWFQRTKFRDWLCSEIEIELIAETAELWDAGGLSDNEIEVVMQNLHYKITLSMKTDGKYRSLVQWHTKPSL